MTRGLTRCRAAVAGLAALLAACTETESPLGLYGDIASLAAASLRQAAEGAPPPARMPVGAVSPDVLDRSPEPMIALTLPGAERIILSAAPDAGETFRVYHDVNRRGLRMREGAVAGTYGFGVDLIAVRHQWDDPIARPMPLTEWPGRVDREYQYRLRDLENYSITVSCAFERVARENIEVIERHETVRIVETCTNQRRSFQNTYWVEPETGLIRRSEQWTGPFIRPVIVETLRPGTA